MQGFVQAADRRQTTLLPEGLEDWVDENNSVRAVDVFDDALELRDLGFSGVDRAATGRPAYHPSPMLKLYIYGYPGSLDRRETARRCFPADLLYVQDRPDVYVGASGVTSSVDLIF